MVKKFSKVLNSICIASMMLVSVVGCTQSQTKEQATATDSVTQETSKEEDKQEEKKLEGNSIVLMASQNWIKDVDRQLFKAFEEETGIEVKILLTPDNGYETLLGTSLAGGSNAADMFMYSAGSMMVSAGIPDVALDLTGEGWTSELEEWAVSANTYDDKLYGFSTWGVDYEGILYNKSYFKENNLEVPTTWDDFMKLCDQIVALGKTPLYESINGVWHTQSWLYALTPVMYKENPEFINELNSSKENKFASSAKLTEGLTQLQELLGAKQGGKTKYFTNDGQAEDWFGSYPSLQNRDTVMMFAYSAYASELEAKGSTDEWGMFPAPLCDNTTAVSNGGGVSKFINKNSENIDACKALLDFLSRPENLEIYYGARTDLVSSAFKNVKSVKPTTATTEVIERSAEIPPIMMIKDILYWDADIYKYFQGLSLGTLSVEQFINNMDNFRATMFDVSN